MHVIMQHIDTDFDMQLHCTITNTVIRTKTVSSHISYAGNIEQNKKAVFIISALHALCVI